MSRSLDIFLAREQTMVGWFKEGKYQKVSVPATLDRFTTVLAEIAEMPEVPADVNVYMAEDLLFFSQFELAAETPNLQEAIDMQLDMLTPFGGGSVFAYTSKRDKEGYHVQFYAAERVFVEPFLRQIHSVGLRLVGLFPESQRYLNRETRKSEWGLWVSGRFGKLLHLKEGKLVQRWQCPLVMPADELARRTGLETIYSLDEVEGFSNSTPLLAQPAQGQQFNMLPKSYRQPDYVKGAMLVLLAVNMVLLLALGATSMLGLQKEADRLAAEVAHLQPQVEEVLALKSKEKELEEEIANFQELEGNHDFLSLLALLSKELPKSAYLDQLRLDKAKKAIHIQGYSDDLGELTSSLQQIGHATLKSTRKRRNQTYFHVEVDL